MSDIFSADQLTAVRQSDFYLYSSARDFLPLAAIFSVVLLTIWWLAKTEAVWWCSHDASVWSSDVWSRHNSQHLLDPYTLTHLLYGVLGFWVIRFSYSQLPLRWQFFLVASFACVWEMTENSSYVIERYRLVTASADYVGDAFINSISDILICLIGFWLTRKVRFAVSLALFLTVEILMLLWVKDNLTLNILMLVYPVDAIKHWQIGI